MSIQILSPQLANQIAAGEVVERPASVVKELIENSLDAGATIIDIDIERGGSKLIRIRDNGCGINQDELTLALARHATSKIASLDDLEAIISLGFRGEALASISSVARLTLTSRTAEQNEAWRAYAEGRDMNVTLKPAAHPVGTTVEVLDLFYNTPARRRFLRTEKTEFSHIDEIIRRIALSRFDVSINLQHNGKRVRQYPAVKNKALRERRIGAICGNSFLQQALTVSWQHSDLNISGWVVDPQNSSSHNELQYCYVNGRMMRDRLLNHAIRQAYQDKLSGEIQPSYVLYLDVDPKQVDVNVHPAKHEVRFHQSRLVHDFVYQAVLSVLQQAVAMPLLQTQLDELQGVFESDVDEPALCLNENRQAAGENVFNQAADKNPPMGNHKNKGNLTVQYTQSSPRVAEKQLARENHLYQQLLTIDASSVKQSTTLDEQLTEPEKKPELFPKPKPLLNAELFTHVECFPSKQAKTNTEQPDLLSTSVQSTLGSLATMDLASDLVVTLPERIGQLLTVWQKNYALVEYGQGLALLALNQGARYLKQSQLMPNAHGLKPQPLLIPVAINLSEAELMLYKKHQNLLIPLGIQSAVLRQRLEIHAVPVPLRQQNLPRLFSRLIDYFKASEIDSSLLTSEQIAIFLATQLSDEQQQWSRSNAVQLLTDLERLCPEVIKAPPTEFLQPLDLRSAMTAFINE